MRRLHLFEWEDQAWLPVVFRDFITDHLRHFLTQSLREPINRAVAQLLKPLMLISGTNQIIDLCSGAGGPLLQVRPMLAEALGQPVDVLLTDLYPNVKAFKQGESDGAGSIKARYESTNAFDIPNELHGVRTLFTALHHFEPDGAKLLLADAASKRQPIAIIELLERTPRLFLLTGIFALWQSFMLTPFVGRMTMMRFFLTYVIPLAPAVILWDGLVSVLRTYTPEELLAMADGVGATDYEWKSGQFNVPGLFGISMPTIYLVGYPTAAVVLKVPSEIAVIGGTAA